MDGCKSPKKVRIEIRFPISTSRAVLSDGNQDHKWTFFTLRVIFQVKTENISENGLLLSHLTDYFQWLNTKGSFQTWNRGELFTWSFVLSDIIIESSGIYWVSIKIDGRKTSLPAHLSAMREFFKLNDPDSRDKLAPVPLPFLPNKAMLNHLKICRS